MAKLIRAKRFAKGATTDQINHFPWGRILKVHEIGDISVVESYDTRRSTGKRQFHAYVGGKDTSYAFDGLYKAIIYAMAYKKLGLNQSALVEGIFRALNIK